MITGFAHIAFRVTNLDRALDFYCNKLGLTEAFRLDREGEPSPWLVFLRLASGQIIEIFPGSTEVREQPGREAGYFHWSVAVDDIHKTLQEWRERGVDVPEQPNFGLDNNWGFWVTDPDGNRIEVTQIMPDSLQVLADARWEAAQRNSGTSS